MITSSLPITCVQDAKGSLLILVSEKTAEQIVTVRMAIDSSAEAFAEFTARRVNIPLRSELHRSDPDGIALIMPGLVGNVFGVKVGSSVVVDDGGNRNTTVFVMIWDAATLRPRGLISANSLNNHRTAGGFAAATELLARQDSSTHVLYGAGKTAFSSVLHISAVRHVERIIICSRTLTSADLLADRIRRDARFRGVTVETGLTADEAAAQADIITTVTRSDVPVFDGRFVKPGTHINLGGANKRHQREIDDDAIRNSDIWVDSIESCHARSGDLMDPLQSQVISEAQLHGEIGSVIIGTDPGRTRDDQITVFKSMGIAAQDLVLGARILDRAEATGAGLPFDHVGDAVDLATTAAGVCQ